MSQGKGSVLGRSGPSHGSPPVNVGILSDSALAGDTVAKDVLTRNVDFKAFVERMEDIGRSFIVRKKKSAEFTIVSLLVPPGSTSQVDDDTYNEWLDCCLRDYLERKRSFELRFKSRTMLLFRILCIAAVCVMILSYIWPVWEFLIDVEADAHYKALGLPSSATPEEVKKAYRAAIKKWHPDLNPNCGNLCRAETMKIQEAHDVLLARGDQRHRLADQYRDALLQVRSLVFFRVYLIAASAAQELYLLAVRYFGKRISADTDFFVSAGCKIALLGFFALYESLFVSGFNVLMVVQAFYHCVTLAKTSAQERNADAVKKASYVDMVREAVIIVVPLAMINVAHLLVTLQSSAGVWESIFRMAFGCFYVLSFLYRSSPNVYDNFLMRKCSLPLSYVNSSLQFSWLTFAMTELGFLVDDLFVFTCRVPAIYRTAVYVVHIVFLCQFFLLPWDAPILGRRARRMKEQEQRKEAVESSANTSQAPSRPTRADASTRAEARGEGNMEATQEQGRERECRRVPVHCVSPLSQSEIEILTDLDSEPLLWYDVIMLKYRKLIDSLVRSQLSQKGVKPDVLSIAATSDLESVVVFSVHQNGENRMTPGRASARAAAAAPKLSLLCKVYDPPMSRLLALDRGPRLMFPANPNDIKKAGFNIVQVYKERLGADATRTVSQLWRSRTKAPQIMLLKGKQEELRCVSLSFVEVSIVVFFTCLISACVCMYTAPPPLTTLASTRGLPYTLRPLIFDRFPSLPREHVLNKISAGLMTMRQGGIVACTVDFSDAVRHLTYRDISQQ